MHRKIIDYVDSKGNFKSDEEIIENAIWYNLSTMTGLVHYNILYEGQYLPMNYFGISIVSSSMGKSFSHQLVRSIFEKSGLTEAKYCSAISKKFKDFNPNPIQIGENTLDMYIPSTIDINIEGTTEGLYYRALAIEASHFGSVNILNEEILDVVLNSNMNVLKEMYDKRLNAKIIKSDINTNISDIHTNMLVFGSPIGIKKDKTVYKQFDKQLSSGIYRRSFIYYADPKPISLNENKKSIELPDLSFINEFILKNKDNVGFITLTSDAEDFIKHIKSEIIEFVNENLQDTRYSSELGSIDKIIKLAGLHAVLNMDEKIGIKNIKYAYDFYLRCRKTVSLLFCTVPQHVRFYDIIKSKNSITKSEIFEKDIFTLSSFSEDIKMVEELAYRNNEQLIESGKAIKKYSIEPLPKTDLNKIIVSVVSKGQSKIGAKATEYIPYTIPFEDDENSLESLVCSNKRSSFVLVHFENNKRLIKNAIEGQNMIAFDFDGGVSLEDIKLKFKDYRYMIYTTKSHTEDKNRFRLLLPTKNKFFVNNEQHKELISNISETFDIPIYDSTTREQPRLWFTNPKAKIIKNEGELLDVIPHIPETEINERILTNLENIDIDESDKRVAGAIRWFYRTTYKGNRNDQLFKLGKLVKDLGGDYESIIIDCNNNIAESLSNNEIKKIIRSIKK